MRTDLVAHVEFDSVDEGVIMNRSGMVGPPSQRVQIRLARSTDVRLVDEGEGDNFDRVNFDLTSGNSISSPRLHLGALPQTK